MSHYSRLGVSEISKLMSEEVITPEPQFSTFAKYLAEQHLNESPQQALVYLANSHGIQLRSDIKFWMDKREESIGECERQTGPITEIEHMCIFRNYEDLIEKIKELPEEWTVIQITKKFTPSDVVREVKDCQDPGIIITRYCCGHLAERIQPYYVNIKPRNHSEENFMQLLKDLIKIRRDYFTSGGTSRKMKEEYANTDPDLMLDPV